MIVEVRMAASSLFAVPAFATLATISATTTGTASHPTRQCRDSRGIDHACRNRE